ncbi:MAG: leucyl aminopeptidase [Candidatus Kerfeldbacteria bacterium CG08_land_8_20_14_0_20_43_14]|uniref:Probable cytosol aminopeptidase n=1 Tax=Candidatus Kerfeldbacteria bacterium CG08_land_8_20_14_0_20_43_14 TaxID=2014246 RepID=A0A2H0YQG2_9BACT|nr:MAG: leucyl aminopeptidase [Candidatus Kerfeldbacteria bacterium CG08_land_8_20_14_0_20_43_14]
MQISVQPYTNKPKIKAIILAIFQGQDIHPHAFYKGLPSAIQKTVFAYVKAKEFQGKIDEVKVLPFGSKGQVLVLVGKGEEKDWSLRSIRLLIRQIVVMGKQHRIKEIALTLEDFWLKDFQADNLAEIIAEQIYLAAYEYTVYKSTPPGGWPKINKVLILSKKHTAAEIKRGLKNGIIIGEAVNHARDLANTSGGDMTPTSLAEAAVKLAKEHGFKCMVLHHQEMQKLKMGGILGVARGSDLPPTFSILEYTALGHEEDKPLVFIGKGITFDSGGLNVKPETSMFDMHMDMSGAAAVIGAVSAIAQMKLPVRIVGLIPAAENMSAGSAYRPGDQLRTMSGKTIEVKNTDAEGRIILADALTYAEKFKAQAVIDVATLTGAAMAALGQRAAAILSPDENFSKKIQELAESSGDFAWPLPLWPEYESEIKGVFGDVANISNSRYGGAITGAAFLWQFAKKLKNWAHIDIAPTMTSIEGQYLAKGATGAGTRLLVAIARRIKL